LAGVWGMIIATPLLVVAIVLVQQLYVREALNKPIEVTGSTEATDETDESDDEPFERVVAAEL